MHTYLWRESEEVRLDALCSVKKTTLVVLGEIGSDQELSVHAQPLVLEKQPPCAHLQLSLIRASCHPLVVNQFAA